MTRRALVIFIPLAIVFGSIPGCDDGSRPGEIAASVTVIPSVTVEPTASPSVTKTPEKPDKPEPPEPPEIVHVKGGADLSELPPKAAEACAKGPPLGRACPELVPVVKGSSYLVDGFGRPGGRFQVLEMAAGAPGNNFARNSPPRVSHVVIETGQPGFIIDLGEPVPASGSLDSLLATARSGSQLVSPQKGWDWNQKLILAESFPGGGAHGDHLIYEWVKGSYTYRVSLHAWTPGVEAVRTLHAIVRSIRH